jgi:hypothetical protein
MTCREEVSVCVMAMFEQLRYFCGCEYHVDHSTQPVLARVWDGGKAERLFSPGNRAQHLSRTGHWPLGRNEDQLDHGTGRKERSQYHQAAGQGNAPQLRRNPVSILVAKDNRDRLRQLQPQRTRSCLGLGDLNHWHPICSAFPIIRRSRRGWYSFHSHLSVKPIPQLSQRRTTPRFAPPDVFGVNECDGDVSPIMLSCVTTVRLAVSNVTSIYRSSGK